MSSRFLTSASILFLLLELGAHAAQPSAKKLKGPAPAIPATPYALRGIQLGLSLKEFRKSQYPDLKDGGAFGKWAVDVILVCTGDRPGDSGIDLMPVTKNERAIGAVDCEWKLPPNRAKYMFNWTNGYINIGDLSATVTYRFSKDENGELSLRQMLVSAGNRHFSEFAQQMIEHFGKPSAIDVGKVQNKIGNEFQSTEMRWDNGVSTIRLYERADEIDKMALLFTDTKIDSKYQSDIKAASGPPKL